MKTKISTATALQTLGAVAVSVGIGLVFIPAGIIVAGIFSVLFGLALERNSAK